MFENRIYRKQHQKKGLVSFEVTVKETNLNIQARRDLTDQAVKAILSCRNTIESYIAQHPEFATSLVPIHSTDPAPRIIRDMMEAGNLAKVGPMAAVAGAVAEHTGRALMAASSEILVENGGDIFIKSDTETVFSIYAENTPFSMTTGIRIEKRDTAYGLCTSSGTLGHSISFGTADAVTVLSDSCALADAAATAIGNRVKEAADINDAIDFGKTITGILGVVIIKGKHIGLWGDLSLVKL